MPVVPTALSVQGGGFTVLSMTMGFANTFHQSGFFEGLTHLGGISGGSWFATQFAYSEEFYNSVTGINGDTPTEAASKWGETYQNAMENAIAEAQFNNWTYTVGQLGPTCAANSYQPVNTSDATLADFWTVFFNDIQEKLYFPASNYLDYVGSFLDPYISNSRRTSFDAPREGFPNGTLVIGVSIGPDAYDNDGTKTLNREGFAEDFAPLLYSAEPNVDGKWWYYGEPLSITQGSRNNKITEPLGLNPKASIAEVAAGSGSALGMFGCPTLMKRQVKLILESPALNLSASEQFVFSQGIDLCLPFGLQNISSPLLGVNEDDQPWNPHYRYLDGAFSGDSTSVPFTIARIQEDCAKGEGEYVCGTKKSEQIKVALISDGARHQFPASEALFGNCTGSCRATTGAALGTAPLPQVFEEAYPPDDDPGWIMYSNRSYTFSFAQENPSPYLVSYVWRGTLTTVDNPAWNVTAGTKVDFCMFLAAYPRLDYVISPGFEAGFFWSEVYAQVSQEMADSTKALLEKNPSIASFFSPPSASATSPGPTVMGTYSGSSCTSFGVLTAFSFLFAFVLFA